MERIFSSVNNAILNKSRRLQTVKFSTVKIDY